ncbi:hypothetical protein [Streptomyces sp. MUM 178J]|uniref:hypothetical protein n=1 Tax=Streptomyces sp. MUM 178J TaxID=2791991 RepID=UPI001F04D02E|nr:hypothetical protein [Streptomyces sp. MUM 178J]WRQ78689.1 hypothetical protein I3F59_004445 [Streptomyces sp. MUM 178J]
MVRREREKKWRPPFGMPKDIVLLATPEGWRHSVLSMEGGMLCGRLADVPVNADPAEAQAATAAMVVGLAHDFHDADVDVTWAPRWEPGSWTAQVTVAATPPNTCGAPQHDSRHQDRC